MNFPRISEARRSFPWTMLDNKKFIKCVEEHPDLWDKKSKCYKDRNVREKHWSSIGNQMFSDWPALSDEQRQDKIMYMKSKWHNLRDALMRCIRQKRRGSSAAKGYLYEDILSFIVKTSPRRRAPSRKIDDKADNTRSLKSEVEELDTLLTPKNEAVDEIEIEESDLLEALPKAKAFEERLVFSAPSQLRSDQGRDEEEDADKFFLMSLLPDVRRLNDEQRLDFRFHCLEFFRDLRQRGGAESTYSYSQSP